MSDPHDKNEPAVRRRDLLAGGLRGACLVGAAGLGGVLAAKGRADKADKFVWQIDPYKCNACGNCATHCVLKTSAVKCVHAYAMCGYCELWTVPPLAGSWGRSPQRSPYPRILPHQLRRKSNDKKRRSGGFDVFYSLMNVLCRGFAPAPYQGPEALGTRGKTIDEPFGILKGYVP